MESKKFLFLRFSSIGDIILTTPVVRCLKKQFPNAEVHFATKKVFKTLIENNPYIDKYYLLEKNENELIEKLKVEKYDYIIDLHNNLRTSIIKLKLKLNHFKIQSFSFDKLNWQKWILVNFKIDFMPKIHIVNRNMATLSTFGITYDGQGLDYFYPIADEIDMIKFFGNNKTEYAVYVIGGQYFTKKLPLNKMVELCATINLPIVLIGGKEDQDPGYELLEAVKGKNNTISIYNCCGKYNLGQSASVIRQANIVYTHDTGMMHVAAAFKKNIVSIWGNTVPNFGMTPFETNFTIVENKNLNCRPCSKIGFSKCPKGHFECMQSLTIKNERAF